MKIQFLHPVAFVRDIEVSKHFYADLLGLKIIEEHEVFILFEMHFSIHQAKALTQTVFGEESPGASQPQGKNNMLFYFEADDLEGTFSRIKDRVDLIHPIVRQHWGQRVFRFNDPDGHIIEIGEPMANYSEWAAYSGKFFSL
jgi:catechol 2,3-dioxygenase-like lactoylglutathione lyase family enzyme